MQVIVPQVSALPALPAACGDRIHPKKVGLSRRAALEIVCTRPPSIAPPNIERRRARQRDKSLR
jgi:hypothetical protein